MKDKKPVLLQRMHMTSKTLYKCQISFTAVLSPADIQKWQTVFERKIKLCFLSTPTPTDVVVNITPIDAYQDIPNESQSTLVRGKLL